jgi:hypothetical protein
MKVALAIALSLLSTQAAAQAMTDIPLGTLGSPTSGRLSPTVLRSDGSGIMDRGPGTPLTPGMAGTPSFRAIDPPNADNQCLKASDVNAGVYRWVDCKPTRDIIEKAHNICLKKPAWAFAECETIEKRWAELVHAEEVEIIEKAAKQ